MNDVHRITKVAFHETGADKIHIDLMDMSVQACRCNIQTKEGRPFHGICFR